MVQVIQCPRCGWQNEPTAIMCGGCGKALPVAASMPGNAFAPGAGYYPPAPMGADYPTVSGLPTQQDLALPAGVAPAPRITGQPASTRKPAVWPGARDQQMYRPKQGAWWHAPLAVVLTLAVLAGLAVGLWGLVVRPSLHSQVDGAIATALGSMVDRFPAITDRELTVVQTFRASESDANVLLQRDVVPNSGLDSATVALRQGQIVVTYATFGQAGTIYTTLQVQGNQLVATHTQVDGIASWVETGDELQFTINQALQQLQTKTPHGFRSVVVNGGQIVVVLNTAGS